MKEKEIITRKPDRSINLEGYPLYPESEDIFNKSIEEKEIDPEDISRNKESPDKKSKSNEKDFFDDETGGDLDVPGSELDDNLENIGSEDEENNYYSLGEDVQFDPEDEKDA